MDRNQVVQFLWQMEEKEYVKRRLFKEAGHTTLLVKRQFDGLLLAVSQPGGPAPLHLSIHATPDLVILHFESGGRFQRDLFRWSYAEFEEVVRRWLRFAIDYRFDLALFWRFFGLRKLHVVPLDDESIELLVAPAKGSQAYQVGIETEELARIWQWFAERFRIPEEKPKKRAQLIDGVQLLRRVKRLRVPVLVQDPMMPGDFVILDEEGRVDFAAGPKAGELLEKRLRQWFPNYESTLQVLIKTVRDTGMADLAVPLLLEALLVLQYLPT